MKLLNNTKGRLHFDAIRDIFQGLGNINIAIAFLKESGVKSLLQPLYRHILRGNKVIIICGLDFGLTEPKALISLFDISQRHSNLDLYICIPGNKKVVFHPKIFMAVRKDSVDVIIGSANLTAGGLVQNFECSVCCTLSCEDGFYIDLKHYFENLVKASRKLTLLGILQYEPYYLEQKRKRQTIQSAPPILANRFDYARLSAWLNVYKRRHDMDEIFKAKSADYDKARKVLDTIADTANLTRSRFVSLFEQLVGSATENALWHSGSIFRKKTTGFEHAHAFQKLVRFIRSSKRKSQSYVFNGALLLVADIEGSGVNTVTEIMMTYDRNRFANLNKNPITVLKKEGGASIKAHRNSYNGQDYALYCRLITEITQKLALRNMLEADSFFNNIYWELVRQKRG